MEKKVYIITREEYTESENKSDMIEVHETLEGANEALRNIILSEKTDYVHEEATSTDTSEEALEHAGIEELTSVFDNGTLHWHIWLETGWHELFIGVREEKLLR